MHASAPENVRCLRIAVVVFDGFDELDAIAPYEVFRHAAKLGADVDVGLITLSAADEVVASGGPRLRPHGQLEVTPDIVLIPGGGWNDRAPQGAWAEAERGELPRILTQLHQAGTTVATVCTGGMLAPAAGLTNGRLATTHHTALDELPASGADVVEARVVDDGDLVMASGVTSGIDLALWLVERELGSHIATAVAEELEYPRKCRYRAGGRGSKMTVTGSWRTVYRSDNPASNATGSADSHRSTPAGPAHDTCAARGAGTIRGGSRWTAYG